MATQFYVPWAEWNVQTVEAAPPGTIFVDVSGSADSYWEALNDIWSKGETFAIIEHDVICRPDVVEQFDACDCLWGTFGYANMCHEECREAWANMLGCTRFRAELIAAVPNALSSIPEDQRDWHNVCDSLAGDKIAGVTSPLRPNSLRAAGFSHHWHTPYVGHHPWFESR